MEEIDEYRAHLEHFSILFNMLYEKYSNDINILQEGDHTHGIFNGKELKFYQGLRLNPYPLSYCADIEKESYLEKSLEEAYTEYIRNWYLSKYINFDNNQEYQSTDELTKGFLEDFSSAEGETPAKAPAPEPENQAGTTAPEPEHQAEPTDVDLKRTESNESFVWTQDFV